MRMFALVFLAVLLLATAGCNSDKTDFEKAKADKTEASLQLYIDTHPDGKYVTDAKVLLKDCVIAESVRQYKQAKDQARQAEKSGNWSKALTCWATAQEKLREDYLEQSVELQNCRQEAQACSKICKTVIENPAEVKDEEVTIGYYYTSFKDDTTINNRRIRSVSVKGTITNNCPFPISDIELSVILYQQSVLTINTVTGEDVSYDGADQIASIKKVVCVGQSLQPGKSRKFSISGKVSVASGKIMGTANEEMSFYTPDPTYSIDVKAYKAR
jgi:hypothetical protein